MGAGSQASNYVDKYLDGFRDAAPLIPSVSPEWDRIDHVTKIDPEKIPEGKNLLYTAPTDAYYVGGTDNFDDQDVLETIDMVNRFGKPVFFEPFSKDVVTEETVEAADYFALSIPWNGDLETFRQKHEDFWNEYREEVERGKQEKKEKVDDWVQHLSPILGGKGRDLTHRLIEEVGDYRAARIIDRKIVTQGYVINNIDCEAADFCGVEEEASLDDIRNYAWMTNHTRPRDVQYVERSGEWSDKAPDEVKTFIKSLRPGVPVIYGGGVNDQEKAEAIRDAGGIVMVGTAFEEDPEAYLETTPAAPEEREQLRQNPWNFALENTELQGDDIPALLNERTTATPV